MPTPVDEQLLILIEAAINTISVGAGASPGDSITVVRTYREGETVTHLPEWPAVILVHNGDVMRDIRLNIVIETVMDLSILTFMKEPDITQKALQVSQARTDIIRKIKEDQYWSDLAAITEFSGTVPTMTDISHPEATSVVRVLIRYNLDQRNPYFMVPLV